jgi:hypothetical protein
MMDTAHPAEGNIYERSQPSARSGLFMLIIFAGLVSCHSRPQTNSSGQEGPLSFNLSAITSSDQSQMFSEVSLLPNAVLEQFQGGIAGPRQTFNSTDINDGRPSRLLVAAAVSEQYCIVSYWRGGFVLTFQTAIFELSDGRAKLIWLSIGQGGLSFRDLKAMVESGRMHNDLERSP